MFLSVITINKMSFADIFATISKMESVVVLSILETTTDKH